MMKRIGHDVYATVFGIAYLGLMINLMVLIAALPVVLLLLTSDPARSWPLIALALPLSTPAFTAAFTVFHAHSRGDAAVIRTFLAGWRATWRRAMLVGAMSSATLVVLLVDVRVFAPTPVGVAVVPLLGVLTVLAVGCFVVTLVAIAEAPSAPLGRIMRASRLLSVRRWYLSALTLGALAVQFAAIAGMPAIGLGITAAPALYLAWANARHTLQPALAPRPAA